jgi:predicted nucleic acid-binding protein
MKLAYVDSSVWIARIEGLPLYRKTINDCLNKLDKDGWLLCVSELVLLEVLPKPYKSNNDALIDIYNTLFEQTKMLKSFPNVFKDALMIAESENLKGMDAIHVAIALQHNCKCFISTDTHFKNLKVIPVKWIDLSKYRVDKTKLV